MRKGNYERLFNEARRRVRAWEKANLGAISKEAPAPAPAPHQDVQVLSAPNPGEKK